MARRSGLLADDGPVAKNLRIVARTHSQNLECLTGKPRTVARAALDAVGHDNDSAYQLLMSDMAVTVIDGSDCGLQKLEAGKAAWTDAEGTIRSVGAFAGCTLLQVSRERSQPLELFALEPVDVCVLCTSRQPLEQGWVELEYTEPPEVEGIAPGSAVVQTRRFDPGSVRIPLEGATLPLLRIMVKTQVAAPRNTVRMRKRQLPEPEPEVSGEAEPEADATDVPDEPSKEDVVPPPGEQEEGNSAPSRPAPAKKYKTMEKIGAGSFGTVVLATDGDGKQVAIKQIQTISGMKSREVELLRQIAHPFVVQLLGTYEEVTRGRRHLCIVMEYLPQNLHQRIAGKPLEVRPLRVFSFQLLRALLHLHGLSICHRDVKPENIMVSDCTLKLVDFGSAKQLQGPGPSHHYICSRWWRAPELVLGSNFYTTRVDWWSGGCVIAEMMFGQPIFPGSSSWGQMYSIIRALGTPTAEEVRELNPKQHGRLSEHLAKLAQVGRPAEAWKVLLPAFAAQPDALRVPAVLLRYSPEAREHLSKVLCSRFYAELVHDAGPLPAKLLELTDTELGACESRERGVLSGFVGAHKDAATVAVPEDDGGVQFIQSPEPQSGSAGNARRKGWVRKARPAGLESRRSEPTDVVVVGTKRTANVALVNDQGSDAPRPSKRRKEVHFSPQVVPSRESDDEQEAQGSVDDQAEDKSPESL
mmetsp:Transcript_45381/g.105287  ORF Transcript_45381/g.105287 Transcript_45381/m.105287 type:complete len:698 (+) Transcript_45381:52-2145(+)